jgi:hypothetical protein
MKNIKKDQNPPIVKSLPPGRPPAARALSPTPLTYFPPQADSGILPRRTQAARVTRPEGDFFGASEPPKPSHIESLAPFGYHKAIFGTFPATASNFWAVTGQSQFIQ